MCGGQTDCRAASVCPVLLCRPNMEEELTELLPIPDTTAVGGKQPDNRPDDHMTRQKPK